MGDGTAKNRGGAGAKPVYYGILLTIAPRLEKTGARFRGSRLFPTGVSSLLRVVNEGNQSCPFFFFFFFLLRSAKLYLF